MNRPRNGAADRAESSNRRGRQQSEGSRRDKNEGPSAANRRLNKSNPSDLPPNQNIRKHADEVYGDTKISERKEDT
jgi:hypothetical protein